MAHSASAGGAHEAGVLDQALEHATASPGSAARAEVLGNPDLIQIITSHVGDGDMLCWALVGKEFHAAKVAVARRRRWMKTPVEEFIAPDPSRGGERPRLQWLVAGTVALVVEGHSCAAAELEDEDLSIVDGIVDAASEDFDTLTTSVGGSDALEALKRRLCGAEDLGDRSYIFMFRLLFHRALAAAVVVPMRLYVDNASVQERGCRELRRLVKEGEPIYWPNRRDARQQAKAGGFEATLAAMRAHGGSARVQECACAALYTLAGGWLGSDWLMAAEAGAIETVVAAMRAHGGSARVQHRACAALCNATPLFITSSAPDSSDNVVQTRAAEAGAIEAVVAAMRAHRGSIEVQKWACNALEHLTDKPIFGSGNPTVRAHAADAGAIEAVVAAMRAHVGSDRLQINACGALERCMKLLGDESLTHAVDIGAIDTLVFVMRQHVHNCDVLEPALSILKIMSRGDDTARAAAVAAKAVEAVEAAVRRWGRRFWEEGDGIVRRLTGTRGIEDPDGWLFY